MCRDGAEAAAVNDERCFSGKSNHSSVLMDQAWGVLMGGCKQRGKCAGFYFVKFGFSYTISKKQPIEDQTT